jgi:hypothetical protein
MQQKSLFFIFVFLYSIGSFSQLPSGGQWGCPSIPPSGEFDTTCFRRTGEILLGQGYFDHYGGADPVYLVIPQNRPSFALSMAIAWNYYRNVLGRDGMSINQWFATMGQENGFASYNGVQLPATIYDESLGMNVALPCLYPRGCNNNTCGGAGYCWHVSQNGQDGPYHNTLAGYQTISPYVPSRYPGPAGTYHPLYNSNMEAASMNKTFYDLSIYRRAQMMNNIDLTVVEASSPDPYGVEAAQAVAYNLGPNAAQSIAAPGYTLPPGISTNNNWAVNYYNGGVSCYAQRVAAMTAVLDNNQAYAVSRYPAGCGGNVNNWNFYSFYDSQIRWDTVAASIDRLLMTMYPEIDRTAFKNAVKAVFDTKDSDGNGQISFRYEMGGVIDAIVMNLPKDDPGFNAQYAINGTGCKLDCRAPYTVIRPSGPTTICLGQSVVLTADVESPTPSTTYQWFRNGTSIPGATGSSYIVSPSVAGSSTYSVVVCWSTFKESNGAATTCCAEPECSVTVTALGSCSNCAMTLTLTPVSNSCTGMANGSIQASITTGVAGPFEYIWSGPSSGTFTTAALSYTIPNLRDGKYTVIVRRVADPNCRAVQDIFIVPVTVIKESVVATANNSACPVQLNAVLVNQQPNTCNLQVSYGALGGFSWDRSFFMDLKVNGNSSLVMFESYPSAGTRDDPWDWWPFNWPQGGFSVAPFPSGAPNVKIITVSDGDTLSVFGTTLVPLGTAVPGFIDGGVRLEGSGSTVTFTQLGTGTTSNFTTFRYQPPAPANGTRQMGNKYIVTCPVVSPPAYTYSWSPSAGLNNPNIQNPTATPSVVPATYTVTATHPGNPSCQLTSSVAVTRNCAPLPVSFIFFDAEGTDGKVSLTWVTAEEINCNKYFIERSFDGQNFEVIGEVICNNLRSISEYHFSDQDPFYGTSYYRIHQKDTDGLSMYSQIEPVRFEELSARIHPNPSTSDFTIVISGTDKAEITILDMQGRIVFYKAGYSGEEINAGGDLSAGLYIVQVKDDRGIKNYKAVKK